MKILHSIIGDQVQIKCILLLCLIVSLVHTNSNAQLSGTYLIGSSGDYTSFSDAITNLETLGVAGNVVFEIAPGIYNEQLVIDGSLIAKSDPDFSISFIGTGTRETVILNYDGNTENADHTLSVDGIKHLYFEGLTFQNSSTQDYGTVITVGNSATVTDISFDDCFFLGQSRLDYNSFPTLLFFNGGGAHQITVTNSKFQFAYYGLTSFGTSDAIIENNEFIDQSIQSLSLSIDHALVRNNIVENDESAVGYSIGLEMWSSSDFIVDRNTIILNNGAKGMQIQSSSLGDSSINVVSNNYLQLANTTNSMVGVNFDLATELNFIHNTVKMSSLLGVLSFTGGSNVNIYNNVLMNYGDGTVYSAILNVFHNSDYNFVYTEGIFSTLGSTLEEHQDKSGLDLNSQGFYLELPIDDSPILCHYVLDNAGKDLGYSNMTDYFNNDRDTSAPDIGAYEFTPPAVNIFVSDTLSICLGDTILLEPEDSFVSYLWLNDSTTTTSQAVFENDSFIIQVAHSGGCILLDSIQIETQSISVDLGEDQVLCNGQVINIDVEDNYDSYLWSTGETTTGIVITEPDTFHLEVQNAIGCLAYDTLIINLSEIELIPNFLVSGIGCTSDTIQFLEVSNLEPDSVFWDFGDEEMSDESHPTHYFSSVGDYTVNLTASLDGCSLDIEKDIVITSTCPDYLVAYYPLDTAANDISDNAFDGTLAGDMIFVEDVQRGSVAFFDGIDDYIELTTSGALDLINSSFTISAWIKGLSFDSTHPIIGTSVEVDNQGLNLGLSGGKANLSFFNNDLKGTQTIATGDWHFITYSYDIDEETMTIYVDGEQDAIINEKQAFSGFDVVNIGLAQSSYFFNGYIDDLRIWKQTLTEEEIFENYSGYSTELMGHYQLSTDANDLSGNEYHGTIVGDVSFIEDEDRGLVSYFDGSGNYVSLTSASNLGMSESSFSASAWIKVESTDNKNGILGTNVRNGLNLIVRSGGLPRLSFSSRKITSSTAITANKWVHLRFNYIRDEGIQEIFIDGQSVISKAGVKAWNSDDIVEIGRTNNKASNNMKGFVSDLKFRKIEDTSVEGRTVDEKEMVTEISEMIVYPNPSYGTVYLSVKNEGEYYGTVVIYDVNGSILKNILIEGYDEINVMLPCSDLIDGIYLIKTQIGNRYYTKRLLINSQ